jgi:hypothetical protein
MAWMLNPNSLSSPSSVIVGILALLLPIAVLRRHYSAVVVLAEGNSHLRPGCHICTTLYSSYNPQFPPHLAPPWTNTTLNPHLGHLEIRQLIFNKLIFLEQLLGTGLKVLADGVRLSEPCMRDPCILHSQVSKTPSNLQRLMFHVSRVSLLTMTITASVLVST